MHDRLLRIYKFLRLVIERTAPSFHKILLSVAEQNHVLDTPDVGKLRSFLSSEKLSSQKEKRKKRGLRSTGFLSDCIPCE